MTDDPAYDDLVGELRLLSNDDLSSYLDERRRSAADDAGAGEGLRLLAEAAAAVLGDDDRPQDAYRALAFEELGLMWADVEEKTKGFDALALAADIYRKEGVDVLAAGCEFLCGVLLDEFGRHDEAAVLYTQAREVFEAHQDFDRMNDCDVQLGRVLPHVPMACAIRGELERLNNEQLFDLLEKIGEDEPDQEKLLLVVQGWEALCDPRRPRDWHWAGCAFRVGTAWYLSGDHAHAAPAFQEAAQVYRECDENDIAGRALTAAAWSLEELGHLPEAVAAHAQARDDHLKAEGYDLAIDRAIDGGRLLRRIGKLEDSLNSYEVALTLLGAHPPVSVRKLVTVHIESGEVHHALSQSTESLRHYLAACDAVDDIRSSADPAKRQQLPDGLVSQAYLSALGTCIEMAARARCEGDAEGADRLLAQGRDLVERSQVSDLIDRLMEMLPRSGDDEQPAPSLPAVVRLDFVEEIRRLRQRPGQMRLL